jgi:hypothetical protein
MAQARCDVFQHGSISKPMVMFTNAGIFRGHLDRKAWKQIGWDLMMAPFAVADIDRKGYWVPQKWSDENVRQAMNNLKPHRS